jgi:hypothetical protein
MEMKTLTLSPSSPHTDPPQELTPASYRTILVDNFLIPTEDSVYAS